MTDIDELIERLKGFAIECAEINQKCAELADDEKLNVLAEDTEWWKAATALQEMQQTISQLKSSRDAWKIGCHNAAHDLLEAQQRIAELSNDLKSYAAMHVEQESEIGRLSDKFDVAVEKGSPVVLDWETTKHIIELLEGLNND
jgi:predicted  nucleic acid-binding Zn-ribbon protein